MIFKRFSFYFALAGLVGLGFMLQKMRSQPPVPPPVAPPTRSPFAHSVAATGIIEATKENVRIATSKPGLVQKVLVQVGSNVKSGEALFQLDDREARARLATARSQLDVLQATLEMEKVLLADWTDQWERAAKLEKEKISSEEERTRKQFAVNGSKARLAKIEADLKATQNQIHQSETELEVLTIRAPRDGQILQLNIRAGEYANVQQAEPLMILGDVGTLQIRADVDEQNAPLVVPNQAAVAYLKGDTKNPIPVRFVRIEPFVVPKRSLTGDTAERVDTRVLQIIFQMDRPASAIYVGQQVDVYIERPGTNTATVARQ